MTEKNNTKKRYWMSIIWFLILAVFLVGFDQFTKQLAVQYLKDGNRIALIPNVLYLLYLENRGAAFGMMQGMQSLFYVITVVVAVGLCWVQLRIPAGKRYFPLKAVSLLIFSGAIGNFIDRVLQKYVVDFIYFSPIDFPVFNVADIYVTVGCGLMIVLFLFYYKEEEFTFLK